ncbi:hypothetical protein B0H16DRAFT_1740371 [Mycena metata]|uniref:Metallo-beta-lactamase domain-containing protein n=1 Tax=Mycena metata TaxID=1033252 RepID=A0AAD7HCU1_9AGAR|nr:hypothetical protein B0H16DRAFT_1740371 [Mycena metata]
MSYIDLGIPPSNVTVSVTAFNAVDPRTVSVLANTLMKPVGAGHELFRFPIFTFLITHAASGRRVLFDLGVRKDLENTALAVAADVRAGLIVMPVECDFVEQLGDYGVEAGSISAAIWRGVSPFFHAHFDHIGDVSKFPASTDLVFGVGTPCETRPSHPHAMLMESDLAGRNLVPIAFDESSLQIGGFKATITSAMEAFTFWTSLAYHLSGHMCALTRVTPTSFLFLGGDAAHHVGMLRPTAALHRAFPAPPALLTSTKRSVALTAIGRASNDTTDAKPFDLAARTTPILDVAEGGYYEDAPTSRASIDLISAFDANPDVLVVLAHDESLLEIVGPAFPAKLDGWKERGWKERAVWAFLEEGNAAFRFGDKDEEEMEV